MSLTEDLYKELILEHARTPSHTGHLDKPSLYQEGVNRSCGDEVEIEISIKDGVIHAIRANSKGCSISVASASMMADYIEGMTTKHAEKLIENFKAMIVDGQEPSFSNEFEDLQAFIGVRKYPIRVKCATLAWTTLEHGLKRLEDGCDNA